MPDRVMRVIGIEWLDPGHILDTAGAAALWIAAAMLFAECGLLLGFFLPGDTLLFSVGVFVSAGLIEHSVWFCCVVLSVGAILGNICGYEIGRAAGPVILRSKRSRLLKQHHVDRTEAFFDKYGTPAILLARFVPIVRTVITVVAGVAQMGRRRYLTLSTIGGVLWCFSVTLVGYYLGQIPFVRDYIQPHLDLVLLGVVLISVLPVIVHVLVDLRRSRRDNHSKAGSH